MLSDKPLGMTDKLHLSSMETSTAGPKAGSCLNAANNK